MKLLLVGGVCATVAMALGIQSSELKLRPSSSIIKVLPSALKLEAIRKAGINLRSKTPRAALWLSPLNPKSSSPKGFLSYVGTFSADPIFGGVVELKDHNQYYGLTVKRPTDAPDGVPVTYLITLHVDSKFVSDVTVNAGGTGVPQQYYFYETGLRQHTVAVSSVHDSISLRQEALVGKSFLFYGADIEIYR
jgi:hypothetical protein